MSVPPTPPSLPHLYPVRRRDVIREAVTAVRGRRGRTIGVILVVAMAVAALLATTIISGSAAADVRQRLLELRAGRLAVHSNPGDEGFFLARDYAGRLRQLPRVRTGGLSWTLPSGTVAAFHRQVDDVPIVAAAPGALNAMAPTLTAGRTFDIGHGRRGDRVALVGPRLVNELGAAAMPGSTIEIRGVPFTVIGVISDVRLQPDALLGVIVPNGAARHWWQPASGYPPHLLVRVEPEYASITAQRIPILLRPAAPESLSVTQPLEPEALVSDIDQRLRTLLLAVSVVLLLIGTATIVVQLSATVSTRRPEIGLRRALGASGRQILLQFLTEGAVLAVAGTVVGAILGLAAGSLTALVRGYPIVIGWAPLAFVPVAVGVGVAAALIPAHRATRVNPVDALRGS